MTFSHYIKNVLLFFFTNKAYYNFVTRGTAGEGETPGRTQASELDCTIHSNNNLARAKKYNNYFIEETISKFFYPLASPT